MTKKDVQVVCREFGLPWNGAQLLRNIDTVPSSYFKWSNINCNGTEQSLLDCDRDYDSSTYCYNRRPATIACPSTPWIRLVSRQTTNSETSGILQVYHNKEWGYVCESGFGEDDAKVACRELGLPTKYVQEKSGSTSYGSYGSKTHLKYVNCNGDEETLSDCSADNGSYCYGYTRVKILCDSGKTPFNN
ncbi:neurotrypsin-like [Saccostrea cucullata]|uniref:neurotrypsin-like n=1 Tax=Saccostrea cuccullata TaxID=36930 RepID=UPI002ED2A2F4